MRRHFIPVVSFIFFLNLIAFSSVQAEFPDKPIKIVVYTEPGGLIDITARKIANILQENQIASPVVVENRKGAGGVVALAHVLQQPADGYTILGLTSSLVSKVTSVRKDSQLEQLHYISRMAEDYECLITHRESGLNSLADILRSASEKAGNQVWAGPAVGGTDHLFAQKLWHAANMKARWIPYPSGGEAIAALLGRHADVYVGNSQDVAGRVDLQVVAVASPQRLPGFPEVQTFAEAGLASLADESLWRGFAVRKGVPAEVVAKLEQIFRLVSENKEWQTFLKSGDVNPIFETHDEFRKKVLAQIAADRQLLKLKS